MTRNIGLPEGILQGGRILAPYHGAVLPPSPDLRDGPVGGRLRTPLLPEHVPHCFRLPIPNFFAPLTETAAPTVDLGPSAFTPTPTGIITYGASLIGWTRKWISIPSLSGNGLRLSSTQLWDPGMPLFGWFDFQVSTTGGDRTIYTAGPNLLIQLKTTGFLQLFATGSTLVVGNVDYRSATLGHRVFWFWEPSRDQGRIFRVWTRQEELSVTAGSGPGGSIAFAGAGPHGLGATGNMPAMLATNWGLITGRAARGAANLGATRRGGRSALVECGANVVYA